MLFFAQCKFVFHWRSAYERVIGFVVADIRQDGGRFINCSQPVRTSSAHSKTNQQRWHQFYFRIENISKKCSVYYLRLVFRLAGVWQFVFRKPRAERCSALSWMLLDDPSEVRSSRISWTCRSCSTDTQAAPRWNSLCRVLNGTNGRRGPVTSHTSFSQSASAFCLRRISTSTWLRACFSLTSSAPLSVSALVSPCLQEPSSSWVLSHLRRQSSKFWTIWMKSGMGGGGVRYSGHVTASWERTSSMYCYWQWASIKRRTINYSLGSMFSLRRSTCVHSLSYRFWRCATVLSMVCFV